MEQKQGNSGNIFPKGNKEVALPFVTSQRVDAQDAIYNKCF